MGAAAEEENANDTRHNVAALISKVGDDEDDDGTRLQRQREIKLATPLIFDHTATHQPRIPRNYASPVLRSISLVVV